MDDAITAPSIVFLAAVPPDNDARGLYQYGSALTRPVTILHAKPWDTKERLGYARADAKRPQLPCTGCLGGAT